MMPDTIDTRYTWGDDRGWTFEATVDPYEFARTVEPVTAIADECAATISASGMEITVIDPAHVAILEVSNDCVKTADGKVRAGFHVSDTVENWPGYYPGQDDYRIKIEHGTENDTFTVDNGPEGRHTTAAFGPDTVREGDWPSVEDGYQTSFELATPKVRGVLGSMADSVDDVVRLRPGDGHLLVDAIEDESVEHSWLIDADVTDGEYQYYSVDYLAPLIDEFWTDGYTTVRFGKDQPLELQNDTLRFALAPRPYEMVGVEA